jgi:hypothetical protein
MYRNLFLVTCTALTACGTSSSTTESAAMSTATSVANLKMTGGH